MWAKTTIGVDAAPLEVAFEPFELVVAEITQGAGLEINDVDELDDMHPVGVEAIPAGALCAAAIALACA
jgi:hypothetical protein